MTALPPRPPRADDAAPQEGERRQAQPRVRLRSFSQSLPILMLQAREAVMERFRGTLRHFRITEQQWRVLRALAMVPGIEVGELARATCLLPPSLSRILQDMEARGYVLRRPVAGDLRRAEVSITDEGRAFIAEIAPHSESTYREVTEAFGPERMAQLSGLLQDLVTEMRALGEPPAIEIPESPDAAPAGEAPAPEAPLRVDSAGIDPIRPANDAGPARPGPAGEADPDTEISTEGSGGPGTPRGRDGA
ncbi:homoprotocatechuate degradation operon regulator HpaR [Mesobaculum littorinae]|uniref:Homoprotocatechuate degradation operon regulator HpaR n=1 Tax=Mesobaculum littorinae TaxID=2486419 RepID=A0A438AHG4_9RHOB|nr:homoprotocatechuate degradation operon regulator HpaR [Mesobaculum littorinae]RVV98136.1 homoprotocatechuate degradation operon regulator HpaR [Mesobaculum littorinae]